jgi:hypothetical protein
MKGEWIVPVVVLIVWLVSTILKSRGADEPVRPRQPGGGDGRKPTSDIDRFLQEIDRLRRKTADEQPVAARPAPPPPPPRVRPAQGPPRVRPAKKPVRLEAVPEVVAVEAAPVIRPLAAMDTGAYGPAPIAPARPSQIAQVSMVELRQSPGVAVALKLLSSRRSIAGAVVLQEVLGPPKCRKAVSYQRSAFSQNEPAG